VNQQAVIVDNVGQGTKFFEESLRETFFQKSFSQGFDFILNIKR
jgi:hypothetical protein